MGDGRPIESNVSVEKSNDAPENASTTVETAIIQTEIVESETIVQTSPGKQNSVAASENASQFEQRQAGPSCGSIHTEEPNKMNSTESTTKNIKTRGNKARNKVIKRIVHKGEKKRNYLDRTFLIK